MRFTIRDLLGFVVVVALALGVWRLRATRGTETAELYRLQNEITSLEAMVRLDMPGVREALLRTQDEVDGLRASSFVASQQLDVLRAKYGALEPRAPDVLSLRNIPSPYVDSGSIHSFRLSIPEQRAIWLKCGVHISSGSLGSARDIEPTLVKESPYDRTGPFQFRLPPGELTLALNIGHSRAGRAPLTIQIDGTILLETAFVAENVSGSSSSYSSPKSQWDIPAKDELPVLYTVKRQMPGTGVPFEFSVWLSDHSSNFVDLSGDGAVE